MRARLYSPAKTAMSSGMAKAKGWVIEFEPAERAEIDPLMGWTSSGNTQQQVRLRFDSLEAAVDYAEDHGIELIRTDPTRRKPNIRAGGYGDNFATNRRTVWTH